MVTIRIPSVVVCERSTSSGKGFPVFDTRSVNTDSSMVTVHLNLIVPVSAMPCWIAFVVNELTTNAIQHGMAETGTMRFECTVTIDESVFTLLVSNTGKPFPLDVDLSQTTTLGMRIVTMLVDQLDG